MDLPQPHTRPSVELRSRFAALALACVHREYPNLIHHVLLSEQDVAAPRELTPVFYGCYDWHSAVHAHWLLARLLRLGPQEREGPQDQESSAIRSALMESLQSEKVAGELEYMDARPAFERPYGLAWLFQLSAELHGWDEPDAQIWSAALEPLVRVGVHHFSDWLEKLSFPIRSGEHSQTAFAMGLALDYARTVGDHGFEKLLVRRAQDFHSESENCPLAFEPSGHDFLSPCLGEADLMRRVLPPAEFADWLGRALPDLSQASDGWLPVAAAVDRSDGKLAHLDGLNLSRAWMLEGIARGLPKEDPRVALLLESAQRHREVGLSAVSGEHYAGGHWLGSFAVYLTTGRGLGGP